jgi:hypothetical protein
MSYSKETNKAAQDSYHKARAIGHTKKEARSIRDNWKTNNSHNSNDDDDDVSWYSIDYDDYGTDKDCIME